MHVTRDQAGVRFTPADDHHGVRPTRLHGQQASSTEHVVATRSDFDPGAFVEAGAVVGETIYFVLSGEMVIDADEERVRLGAGDSVHLADGTVRALQVGDTAASVLVVRVR